MEGGQRGMRQVVAEWRQANLYAVGLGVLGLGGTMAGAQKRGEGCLTLCAAGALHTPAKAREAHRHLPSLAGLHLRRGPEGAAPQTGGSGKAQVTAGAHPGQLPSQSLQAQAISKGTVWVLPIGLDTCVSLQHGMASFCVLAQ